MRKMILLTVTLGLLSGCGAAGPSISELRQGVRSATFVQHGNEPLSYSFGVVDTASFWSAHGSGVSAQLGGGALWEGLAAGGRGEEMKRAPTVAEVMQWLYNKHPLANNVVAGVMPRYAQSWGVGYDPAKLRVLGKDSPVEDQDGFFTAFNPVTDLVLVAWVNHLSLTEKFSVGGAFAAGFTLGTNTKNVTAESLLWMRAYKRDPASGRYKRIWHGVCGVGNMQMDTAYPFPELVKSREKARALWDEATPKMIELCNAYLKTVGGGA